MAGLTDAQKTAFARQILELIEKNRKELLDVKFDVDGRKASLVAKITDAEQKEADQIKTQATAKAKTEIAKQALKECYLEASSDVDAIVGLLGKTSPLSKRIRNIRDSFALEAARGKKKGQ